MEAAISLEVPAAASCSVATRLAVVLCSGVLCSVVVCCVVVLPPGSWAGYLDQPELLAAPILEIADLLFSKMLF